MLHRGVFFGHRRTAAGLLLLEAALQLLRHQCLTLLFRRGAPRGGGGDARGEADAAAQGDEERGKALGGAIGG